MRVLREFPVVPGQPAPRFVEIQQHLFDIHLSFGKWSAHIATKSGIGRFFGPLRNEGRFYLTGKCVTTADCYLPHQVKHALIEGGFDCGGVRIA